MMHRLVIVLPLFHSRQRGLILLLLWSIGYCQVTPAYADLLAGSYALSSVLRFADDGTPLTENDIDFGSAGLNQASAVTVGPDGNIYVSSIASGEILFYDGQTGTPLPSPHAGGRDGLFATLANEGNEDMPVGGPGPLRFGPDGKLYVADFNGNSIRVFDGTTGEEGAPAGVMDLNMIPGKAGSVAFGPDGALYAGDFNTASVYRFENGIASYYVTSQSGGLYTASSLLFLPDGHLLVSDLTGNKLIEYDENGQNPVDFAVIPPLDNPPNPEGQNPFGSNFPSDLTLDQDGNIVLAVLGYTYPPDNRGQLLRFDLEGNPLGDPPGTPLVDDAPTLSSVAWIKSATAVTGDYDGDGNVDESDYLKWKGDFDKWVAKGGGSDGNADGIVNAGDYTAWRDNVGAGGLDLAAGVPEPSAGLLALCAALVALATRPRKLMWNLQFGW